MRLAFVCRMTKINSFRDLTVWQVSMDLADVCFDIVEAIHGLVESLEPHAGVKP